MENHDESAKLRAELEKLIRWHGEDEAALARARAEITRLRGELAAALERKAADRCADRAAVLLDGAAAIDATFTGPGADRYARYGAALLRRMADETPAAETEADGAPRLCGKDRGRSGLYYRPCARPAGHTEAYCKSADGENLFLAAQPMDPVHILGLYADAQPAAGARQDEPDHVCNSVVARGHMDEPLGYYICGFCGARKGGAQR